MTDPTQCPKCKSENIYNDGNMWVCPECSNEWSPQAEATIEAVSDGEVRDAHGNVLVDGDTISILKDLKVKGSSSTLKSGTKVKNIRLTDAGDGHNISGRVDGVGVLDLKSEFVKKM